MAERKKFLHADTERPLLVCPGINVPRDRYALVVYRKYRALTRKFGERYRIYYYFFNADFSIPLCLIDTRVY